MAQEKIWATLLHLGTNMWRDKEAPIAPDDIHRVSTTMAYWHDDAMFDLDVFHRLTEAMPGIGINTVLIDVGDGIRYDSHPEIGVHGAMTPDALREEVRRLRALGLEPVPKLNFSAAHDAWLGKYQRMLSTDIYRNVAKDLIHEVCEIFEKPKYFHLGMDEETFSHQAAYGYSVVRADSIWWEDFYHLVASCECENARPWIWSDYYWHHKESFAKNMPKTVLQSNWHYYPLKGEKGELGQNAVGYRTFFDLEEMGFDQVPTTTTWNFVGNTEQIMSHLAAAKMKNISGFMTAAWMSTLEPGYYDILGDAARLGYCRKVYGDQF